MGRSKKRRRSRSGCGSGLPRGAYRHPDGGVVLPPIARGYRDGNGKVHRVVIQAKLRAEPDLQRLAKAIVSSVIDELDQRR